MKERRERTHINGIVQKQAFAKLRGMAFNKPAIKLGEQR